MGARRLQALSQVQVLLAELQEHVQVLVGLRQQVRRLSQQEAEQHPRHVQLLLALFVLQSGVAYAFDFQSHGAVAAASGALCRQIDNRTVKFSHAICTSIGKLRSIHQLLPGVCPSTLRRISACKPSLKRTSRLRSIARSHSS